ncbi:MAG: HAMP domain-containing histidine kinase [Saprospiraceae bacterium]|nr:HAMP domain-containing histidine kinase [Saprospiraceae bacterium]
MQWNEDAVSMQEVAETAIAATSSLFDQRSLVLTEDIDDSLPTIVGDKDKLIQVMVNLISNSVSLHPQVRLHVKVLAVQNEILVSIADTGIGIGPL